MTETVKLVDVKKNFGHIKALRGVSLSFTAGQKTSLLGPNGAGKSTLLRIIATQMVPSSGQVIIMGNDAKQNGVTVKRDIGVVGHRSFLYDELTVLENLRFYGDFVDAAESEYERVIKVTDIERWRDTKAGHLSYGLRKRADISRALLGNPSILLLDEFFAGLDQETSSTLADYMKELKEQTIITTSHTPELINGFCDRSVYIRDGLIEKEVQL
ncbi:MAG: ABC transporter ATP-binding protein [Candidatus Bathyarchaeota archaeon]|nr:ABC transporter ATP-binding protein [Candidatus Bathyarchaeota archaeon]